MWGLFLKLVLQMSLRKKLNKNTNQNLRCTHCNKVEHSIKKCFELIGYPS
jgi:hypothetical protein